MNFIDARLTGEPSAPALKGDGFRLGAPQEMASGLADHIGKKVQIGVRSHQIAVTAEPTGDSIPLRLHIVENLGKELMLSGYIGQRYVRVTLADPTPDMAQRYRDLRRSENPYIHLTLQHFNVFDDETGVNLTMGDIG
jgi:hypothetical protein